MTKPRAPGTFEEAIWLVLGAVGVDRARAVTGRSEDYLRDASNDTRPQKLTLEDAFALDLEYRATGRDGAPIFETYGLQLGVARAERFSDADALSRHLVQVLKEGGEANLALALSTNPLAGVLDHRQSVKELTDLRRAVDCALGDLRRMAGLEAEAPP